MTGLPRTGIRGLVVQSPPGAAGAGAGPRPDDGDQEQTEECSLTE